MMRKFFSVLLWLTALGWAAFCLFLTWQTGEGTGALSMSIAQFLLRLLARAGVTPDPALFHTKLRLLAHFGVFCVSGLLFAGALAASMSLGRRSRDWVFFIPAAGCSAGAVLAEVVKLQIPGRHLQWDEAMLNVAGVVLGVFAVWLLCLLSRGIHARRQRRECGHTGS